MTNAMLILSVIKYNYSHKAIKFGNRVGQRELFTILITSKYMCLKLRCLNPQIKTGCLNSTHCPKY